MHTSSDTLPRHRPSLLANPFYPGTYLIRDFFAQVNHCRRLFTPLVYRAAYEDALALILTVLAVLCFFFKRELLFFTCQVGATLFWFVAIVNTAIRAAGISKCVFKDGLSLLLIGEGKKFPTILLGITLAAQRFLFYIPLLVFWFGATINNHAFATSLANLLFGLFCLSASCFCFALITARFSASRADTGLSLGLLLFLVLSFLPPLIDQRLHNSNIYLAIASLIPPFDIMCCPSRLLFNWPAPAFAAWLAPLYATFISLICLMPRKSKGL